jgi:signal transduction histidine kinase/ActR/RegA family two-component response regulator
MSNTTLSAARNSASTAPAQSADTSGRVREDATIRARNHRATLAMLTAAIASYFVGPLAAFVWLAAIFAYEWALPAVVARFITRFSRSDPERARARGICLTGFGGSLYALGWVPSALTGHEGAAYFAAMWVACAMIHALVYNSNDRLVFLASIGPPIGAALIIPFLVAGAGWLPPFVFAAITARVIVTTWIAHNDRMALVSSVNLNRSQRVAAEEASKAKSQFLATMSHELRTPLNAVIGYAEILEEDLAAEGKSQEASDAARIRRAARDLLGLINEVLDFSKIEAGRMDIVESVVDAPALVADVVETCRHIAAANHSSIETAVDPAIGDLLADGARLRQCMLNLVSNAAKFTADGRIDVRLGVEIDGGAEFLRFEVADTGCGIAPEQATRLFQPFVQADGSFTRQQGGTGLGLVITRKLAQLMGGDVTFSSDPGRGSTFVLRIAISRPHMTGATVSGEGPLVVVIEDEAAARDLICRALARLPFQVRCAPTAATGLALARESDPALIVLDIYLPDRSGWDVLIELKSDPATREAPVLIVSVDDDRARALALGACEHIVKPADRDQLAAAALRYARQRSVPNAEPAETVWDDSAVA